MSSYLEMADIGQPLGAGATPRLWGGLAWMEKATMCLGSHNQRPKRRSPDPLGNTIHV